MTWKMEKHNGKRKDVIDKFSADVLLSSADDVGETIGGSVSAGPSVRDDAR